MDPEKIAIHAILRFLFKKGYNAAQAVREICQYEGDGAISNSTAERWFRKFRSGDESLLDKPHLGRTSNVDDEAMRAAALENPLASVRDLSATLGPSKSTIDRHLRQMDFVLKRPRQDPHELTVSQAETRIDVCRKLLERGPDDRFFKQIVTSDEKWIFLVNPNRKTQRVPRDKPAQPTCKHDPFGRKVMISVWWNFEGILHFEFIQAGRSVDAKLYCEQLDRVYEELRRRYPALINRKGVLMQQDNAPAHRAKLTQSKLEELEGVEVLPHPPYSPDCAPSDYGLFRAMQHILCGRRFKNIEEVDMACREFFASKSKEWYFEQIRKLADRWTNVLANDGLYFDE